MIITPTISSSIIIIIMLLQIWLFEGVGVALLEYSSREGCGVGVTDSWNGVGREIWRSRARVASL